MEARNEQTEALVMRDEVFSYSQTLLKISKKVKIWARPVQMSQKY